MDKIQIKGMHGALYEIEGLDVTENVKVTTSEGKVFYIPNIDIGALYQTFELLRQATHVRQELQAKGITWKK